MILDKTQLSLLDGISTEEFGYVKFLTVEDLIKLGEDVYEKIIVSYSQCTEYYDLPKEFKNFDLFFLIIQNDKRLSFKDGTEMIDYILESISLIFRIEKINITVDYEKHFIGFVNDNGKYIIINRYNFDDFADILLLSNMVGRIKKDEEVKFRTQDKQRQAQFLEFLKWAEEEEAKKRNTISMIANMVMAKLKLYGNKEVMRKMTIYNLLFAYSTEFAIEEYNKTYQQYLAGADMKKLDMTHWTERIKKLIKK